MAYLKAVTPGDGIRRTLDPADALASVARHASVSEDAIARIEVPCSCSQLYTAALEYAALHPPVPVKFDTVGDSTSAESASDDHAGPQRPLWQSPDAPFEDESDYDSDSDDSGGSSVCSDDDSLIPGAGLKKHRIRLPKFIFGLGSTAVFWPPAPHLHSSVLSSSSKKKSNRHASVLAASLDTSLTPASSAPPSAVTSESSLQNGFPCDVILVPSVEHADTSSPLQNNHNSSCNGITTGIKEKDVDKHAEPEDGNADKKIVYYFHYAHGDPVPSLNHGSPSFYRTLLLMGVDGTDELIKFAQGVVKWREEKDYHPSGAGRFALYRFKTGSCGDRGYWSHEGLKRSRPVSSVVLPDGQLEGIMDDIRSFLSPDTKSWYVKHGLPHRRSYLFYGPPGTGKTSTIRAIASAFNLNCCFLTMTDRSFNNQLLGDAIARIPANALIVLEDVDTLFNEDRKNDDGCALTFSGMLNTLDGFLSSDGVLTILTTNHISRLNSALIRGGRVDRRFEFARPTQPQVTDLFLSFYPDAPREMAQRFARAIFDRPEGDEARSIATLQQLFIHKRRESAAACLEAVPEFFEMHFPSGTSRSGDILYT